GPLHPLGRSFIGNLHSRPLGRRWMDSLGACPGGVVHGHRPGPGCTGKSRNLARHAGASCGKVVPHGPEWPGRRMTMRALSLLFTAAAVAALTLTACASTGDSMARESNADEVETLRQRMQSDIARAQSQEFSEARQQRQHENEVAARANTTPQR